MTELERTSTRLVDACIALLLAAMALYGAVLLIQEVWVWLCAGLGVVVVVAGIVWLVRARSRW